MKASMSVRWVRVGFWLFFMLNWSPECKYWGARSADGLLGGLSSVKAADASVEEIAESVRSDVTERVQADNLLVTQYTVISYKTQVVAGINYFIKICVNDDPHTGYVHIRVFCSLNGSNQLVGLETGHTAQDPITYIQTFF